MDLLVLLYKQYVQSVSSYSVVQYVDNLYLAIVLCSTLRTYTLYLSIVLCSTKRTDGLYLAIMLCSTIRTDSLYLVLVLYNTYRQSVSSYSVVQYVQTVCV